MKYQIASCTDVGIKKKTNQDAVLVETADTDRGEVLLAVICDGMGGLQKGELAASTVIRRVSDWFRDEFSIMLYSGIKEQEFEESLTRFINQSNESILTYGNRNGMKLGTTITMLIIAEAKYYVMNVGDSRVYRIVDSMEQITHDHTFVQREIDHGRMTYEQAEKDIHRNTLLQCVGASETVAPDFFYGEAREDADFLLCSDGFRHKISEQEIIEAICSDETETEEQIEMALRELIEEDKRRGEEDNISAVLIRLLAGEKEC